MSAEMSIPPAASKSYAIIVEGKLDPSWSDWLGGLQLVSQKEEDGMVVTTLYGELTDQAALRGILNRLWDLNLVVRAVQQVHPPKISQSA